MGSATRTRGLRSQLQPSQSISGSASSNTPPFDVDLTAAQSTMTSTGMVHDPPPPNPSTHLARSSEKTYAVPIADQWQNPSRGWLQNHQDAADAVDREAERKRRVMERNMQNQHTIRALIWCTVRRVLIPN